MQLEAGAADDKPEYRKLVVQISPLLIPPFNGTNTGKAKVTADVRCETSYALSHVGCTVMHTDTTYITVRNAFAADTLLVSGLSCMLTAPFSKQPDPMD